MYQIIKQVVLLKYFTTLNISQYNHSLSTAIIISLSLKDQNGNNLLKDKIKAYFY